MDFAKIKIMTENKIPKQSFCILSNEFDGPFPLSALACSTGLVARALVEQGHEVSVILPNAPASNFPTTHWIIEARKLGINLKILGLNNAFATPFHLCTYLKDSHYDTIICFDKGALGYWIVKSQKQGLYFKKSKIVLLCSEPAVVSRHEALELTDDPFEIALQEMENWLVVETDWLFVTHPVLATHVKALGRKKPYTSVSLPIPSSLKVIATDSSKLKKAEDPMYFLGLGVADERWGVRLASASKSVTVGYFCFLGSSGKCRTGESGFVHIAKMFMKAPERLAFDYSETLEQLFSDIGRRGGIVLYRENSASAAPFLAIAEAANLQVAALRDANNDTSGDESDLLQSYVKAKVYGMGILEALAAEHKVQNFAIQTKLLPLVSVCISHFRRPKLLEQTLESLRRQTYSRFEVVLYDDASPGEETAKYIKNLEAEFKSRDWQILRGSSEVWAAAGRNAAAKAARGDLLLIMDDDNCARPHEIETMVAVHQTTGSDAISSIANLFESTGYPDQSIETTNTYFFPTGHGKVSGAMLNVFGDANCMFTRKCFEDIGGFIDYPSVGCEDYEIIARLYLKGYCLEVIPAVLYDYRFSPQNMAKGISNERAYYSHRRINNLFAKSTKISRAEFELLANIFNARSQRENGSYWTRNGRTNSDPLIDNDLAIQPKQVARRLEGAMFAAGNKNIRIRWLNSNSSSLGTK